MRSTITSTALILGLSATVALAEGNLNIYNWGEYTSPELIEKFSKTYNVHVTLTDFDSNDTALAKVRQGASGYDVVVPSQSFIPTYIEEGLLAETNPGQMENAKNLEERWRDPAFDPGRKYSVPWLWYTSGISVNTSAFKGDINTWKVILDPPDELKGKINIVPEMNDIMFAAIKFEGGTWCTSDKALLTQVRDRLVEAKKSWLSIDYAGIQRMATGDVSASLDWSGSALKRRTENDSIAYGLPREGFTYGSDNVVVLKDAPNLENAKLFQNFIMAPENAALNSVYAKYGAAIIGAEKYYSDDMKGAPELVIPADMESKGELLTLCDPKITQLYSRIWQDVQK
ncbi:extracellular solute-binding protein [Rhizobium giardinii]|uniref:ABC transporter substrate-binding protein n=1 Tax=Rhizobium giardinii TaxID=56731 RepID=UPI003D6F4A07